MTLDNNESSTITENNTQEIKNHNSRNLFYRYALRCNYKKFEKLVDYLKQTLEENEFKIITFQEDEDIILLLSHNNEENLLKQARSCKLKKIFMPFKRDKENDEEVKQLNLHPNVIEQECKKNFNSDEKEFYTQDAYYDMHYKHILQNYKKDDEAERPENWGFGLFTETEMLYLEYKLLKAIKIDKAKFLQLASEDQNLAKKMKEVEIILSNDDEILSVYSYFNIIFDQTPIHVSNFQQNIMKETLLSLRCPYRKIRSYFSDQVAIYYAWFYHYTRWLTIPSLFALFILLLSYVLPDYSKVALTVYSLLLSVWSQLFLIYWNRKCSEITVEWDNYTEEYDQDNFRREFKGEWLKSPITGKYEKYYSSKKRFVKYLISILCSLPMLLLSIFANVCFLNLNGFIKAESDSLFDMKFLSNLTLPGAFLDKDSFANTIVGIVQGLIIGQINNLYDKIALKTTEWENHKVKSTYDNSIIIKRFTFEFFNYFLCSFYLAFVVFNMDDLRTNMVSNLISFYINISCI